MINESACTNRVMGAGTFPTMQWVLEKLTASHESKSKSHSIGTTGDTYTEINRCSKAIFFQMSCKKKLIEKVFSTWISFTSLLLMKLK